MELLLDCQHPSRSRAEAAPRSFAVRPRWCCRAGRPRTGRSAGSGPREPGPGMTPKRSDHQQGSGHSDGTRKRRSPVVVASATAAPTPAASQTPRVSVSRMPTIPSTTTAAASARGSGPPPGRVRDHRGNHAGEQRQSVGTGVDKRPTRAAIVDADRWIGDVVRDHQRRELQPLKHRGESQVGADRDQAAEENLALTIGPEGQRRNQEHEERQHAVLIEQARRESCDRSGLGRHGGDHGVGHAAASSR